MKLNRFRNSSSSFEKIIVATITLGAVLGAHASDPPYNLPPVRAVPSTDGGQIICYGYDCADVLASIMPVLPPIGSDVDVIGDQSGVDRGQFCEALANEKPSGCNSSNPPSTADTDANWQPNGCGTSWRTQAAMQLGIMTIVPDDFAGNFNAPYSGVSFLDACNTHDRCYSVAFDKASCDQRFGDQMREACGVVGSSSGYNVCTGLADIYRGAVSSTTFGQDAYASSLSNHSCAVWAKDMEANGCEE